MKRPIVLLALLMSLCVIQVRAQEEQEEPETEKNYEYEERGPFANLGVGLGLDYGGIGARLSILPVKAVALFGAVGYNLNGVGFNAGASFQLMPKKKLTPTIKVMYGYNAVIVVKGTDQYDKTYNGVSFGGGIQLNSKSGNNFFSAALLIPLRSQEYHDDVEDLLNNSQVTGVTELPPIAISVGYHFKI
jgi:hypothetical protein